MALAWLRGAVDKLTARAVREQLDRRRLQSELDTHRLFLLTTHHRRRTPEGGPAAEDLDAEAQRLGFEARGPRPPGGATAKLFSAQD